MTDADKRTVLQYPRYHITQQHDDCGIHTYEWMSKLINKVTHQMVGGSDPSTSR